MSSILKIIMPACALLLLFVIVAAASSTPGDDPERFAAADLGVVAINGVAHVSDIADVGAIANAGTFADIKFRTVSTVKMAGAAGRAVNFLARLGGGSMETVETTHVKGNKMLQDSGESATLIDLDTDRMVMIDHERKTYTVMTFSDMREQMERISEEMQHAVEEGEVDEEVGPDTVPDDTGSADGPTVKDSEFKYDFNVDRPGTRRDINGIPAERFLMTITVEGKGTVEEEGREETYEGTMVLASDLWLSTSIDGYGEVNDFNRRFAERFGESMTESAEMSGMANAMREAFAGDPRMQEGMEMAQEEIENMEGMEIKNTTYFVLVAAGETFDPDLVFKTEDEQAEAEEEKPKRGLFARAARAARQAATGADQAAEEEQQREAATQAVLLTVTSEMQEYTTGPIPESVFEIPSDYRQVAMGAQ